MAIGTAVFERIGIQVRPDEIEELVVQALEQMLPASRVTDPRQGLLPEETAALVRAGMRLDPVAMGPNDPLVRSAAEYAAMLASSLTVARAARKLGVDASRIRHRLRERTMYGIRLPSRWRLPAFQFDREGLVPGIEQVLPRLDVDLHPLSVLRWLTLSNPDLFFDDAETAVSPLDWLRTGRKPGVVAELAGHVGTGA